MIQVSIQGGNKKQRKLVETAILFGIKKMMPRFRVMTLEVIMGRYEHNGMCKPFPNIGHNHFELEIDKTQDLHEMVKTVFHEMTHVKQFCRKEWQVTGTSPERCRSYWLGSDHTTTPYYRQPWEIEARWMQCRLYREFIKSHKID
jgi:hypothetical protein